MMFPEQEQGQQHEPEQQQHRARRGRRARRPVQSEYIEGPQRPAPAVDGPLDQREDNHRETRRAEQEAVHVHTAILGAYLGDHGEDARQQHRADRHVHQEDPGPGERGGQPAAQQRTEYRHTAECDTTGGVREGPVAAAEHRINRAEHSRRNTCRTGALHDPAPDQQVRMMRRRGEQTARDDQHHADSHECAHTHPVTQPTGADQQGREHHRIGAQHPLRGGEPETLRGDDRRQRHPDDGGIEYQRARGQREHAQRQPPRPAPQRFRIDLGVRHAPLPPSPDNSRGISLRGVCPKLATARF